MEGPLIVIKSWALAALGIWFYRRFFERVAKAEPEFEAWARTGALLAALSGRAAPLALVEAALRARLGKRPRVVATLGGWPWPNYALELRLVSRGNVLELRVARAELLRTRGEPPPSLSSVLREAMNAHPDAQCQSWLCSGSVYGKSGPDAARAGWQLHAGSEPRPRLEPYAEAPSWLGNPEPNPQKLRISEAAE